MFAVVVVGDQWLHETTRASNVRELLFYPARPFHSN